MILATRYRFEGLDDRRPITEALQLRSGFEVSLPAAEGVTAAPLARPVGGSADVHGKNEERAPPAATPIFRRLA
jgi:hypothetical protein